MKKKIPIEDLQDAIADILNEYADDIITGANEAAKQTAASGAEALKERAKMSGIRGTKYVNSFKSKLLNQSRLGNTYVIYSTEYRLAHLLEHGHVIKVHGKRTGGRTRAFHHWSKVEDEVSRQFEQAVTNRIQRG